MPLSFSKTRHYRRLRFDESSLQAAQPRYLLLVTIIVAFVGGYFLGKAEYTPVALSSVWGRITDIFGNDPEQSIDSLIGHLAQARLQIESEMRRDYGEFYFQLFDPVQLHYHIFLTSRVSRERFKRRLMSKVLERLMNPTEVIDFVWSTGGDSSAAGHGNMFNQSYTAVMQQMVQPAFQAIGLNFVGRNYGMSWYQSAPELPLCMEEVYGSDIDALMWDFSLQDQDAIFKTELWLERAMMHPSLPILFFIDNRGSARFPMLQKKLESNGVGSVFMDKASMNEVRSRVPPTNEGNNANSPAVKNWICPGGSVEGSFQCNDPMRFFQCDDIDTSAECLATKYKVPPGCDSFQKSHHPGWKEHQFKGLLLGHFMLDVLEEALIALDSLKYPTGGRRNGVRSQLLFEKLKNMHQLDIKNATLAPVPETYHGVAPALMRDLSPSLLFRGHSVCHTALLPAQSRYLGHMTESTVIGSPTAGGFDEGQNKALYKPDHGKLSLVFESADRARCPSSKIDHKDFFFVPANDDWLSTIVPNHAEIESYQRRSPEGVIIVCLTLCAMDKCPDDYVGFGQMNSQHGDAKISIRVDGKEVKNVLDLDHRCHVLESDNGIRWGKGKAGDGRYKISFNVEVKKKVAEFDYSMRISSIIVM